MGERTLKLAQDHIALLAESFEARGVYVSELQAQIAILTAERDAAFARERDLGFMQEHEDTELRIRHGNWKGEVAG